MDTNGNGSKCSYAHQFPVSNAVASAVPVLSPFAFRFIRVEGFGMHLFYPLQFMGVTL